MEDSERIYQMLVREARLRVEEISLLVMILRTYPLAGRKRANSLEAAAEMSLRLYRELIEAELPESSAN